MARTQAATKWSRQAKLIVLTGEADGGGVGGRKPSVLEGARPSTALRLAASGDALASTTLPARQVDQHLLCFVARSVDQFVIGLVVIGEQAAIAAADAGFAFDD